MGRYITAKNNRESKIGLLLNGLIKVPMQFCILLIGVLVFSFYQFNEAPLSFNDALLEEVNQSSYKDSVQQIRARFDSVNQMKQQVMQRMLSANNNEESHLSDSVKSLQTQSESYRSAFKQIAKKTSERDTNDTNYVFLSFVKHYLPAGLKGLLIAIIFLAAWSSIAAALNSLAASTVCDFHEHIVGKGTPINECHISKWYTLAWGLFAILVAQFSTRLGQSLIEAVNVLGSLFYGVILGIFLVAFYLKKINGTSTFVAAIIVEIFVVILFFNEHLGPFSMLPDISFLWLNVIGAIGVMLLASMLQLFAGRQPA